MKKLPYWLQLLITITALSLMVLIVAFIFSGCQVRTYPGYVKYKKFKKEKIECPGEQVKQIKKKQLKWYKLTHR